MLAATLPLLLALHSITQPLVQDDCPDENRRQIESPGTDPDSVQFEECGATSVEFHYKIAADGSIGVVEAGVEGAIKVTIQTPTRCKSEYIWLGADVWHCEGEREGKRCVDAAPVTVKFYKAEPACPTLPANLTQALEMLGSLTTNGVPLTIPCGKLVDKTEELDPSGRQRLSVRLVDCENRDGADEGTRMQLPSGLVLHQGSAEAFDPTSFVPQGGGDRSEFYVYSGLEQLLGHLASPTPASDCAPIVVQTRSAHPALDWIDGLECQVVRKSFVESDVPGVFDEYETRVHYACSLRANGDFAIVSTEIVDVGEPRPARFRHTWVRRNGDLYQLAEGAESGVVHPRATGTQGRVFAAELQDVPLLLAWLTEPFGLRANTAFEHEVTDLGDGRIQVVQSIDWNTSGAGAAPHAPYYFDSTTTYTLATTGGAPRVLDAVTNHPSGRTSVSIYGEYDSVASGVDRPRSIERLEFAAGGALVSSTTINIVGRRNPVDAPTTLRLPRPATDTWYVVVD